MMANNEQLPLFYKNIVALNRERHHAWFIDVDQTYSFAAKTNSVFVAATEFALAARDYPIVFARDSEQKLVPVTLLGLRPDENLLVADNGTWQGGYLPAYIRRYPFILASAEQESNQFTVCLDESFSGFNTASEGEKLLQDNGEQSDYLKRSVSFLQEFHNHTLVTEKFCAAIDAADILEPMQAQIALNSGDKLSLSGFFCVRREQLKKLEQAQLMELFSSDYLELIYLHMHSLANVEHLMERLTQRLEKAA